MKIILNHVGYPFKLLQLLCLSILEVSAEHHLTSIDLVHRVPLAFLISIQDRNNSGIFPHPRADNNSYGCADIFLPNVEDNPIKSGGSSKE